MQLNITGHQVEITEPLRDYVTNKLEKLERHYSRISNVHVVLRVEKLEHSAEASFRASHADVVAEASAEDMYAAIDALADKLARQMRRVKEKLGEHR